MNSFFIYQQMKLAQQEEMRAIRRALYQLMKGAK